MIALRHLAVALLLATTACREAPRKEHETMSNRSTPAPAPSRTFEQVTLGMTLDEALALAAARGWQQNAQPGVGDQKVTVFPDDGDPVERYKLGFQGGRLYNIELEWKAADPARVPALRATYPRSRHAEDGWNLADAAGDTLVFIDDQGLQLQALHTAVVRDRREVAALFKMALGEAPGGGPAGPIAPP